MSKKTRYILLAIGFIIFVILAPVIVLYVRGINYDFITGKFIHTGILAVRTEPTDANITLNGKLVRKKAGDIKFIKPGEYNVVIKKDGFSDWSKRLTMRANEVTWANPAPNKIFLYLREHSPQTVTNEVSDFTVFESNLVYISQNNLAISSLKNPERSENYPLTKPTTGIAASPSGNFFILRDKVIPAVSPEHSTTSAENILLFNMTTRAFTDVSVMFSPKTKLLFAEDDTLYALENGNLFRVNPKAQQKTIFLANVRDCAILGNTFYCIKQSSSTLSFVAYQLPSLEEQVLVPKLPDFSNSSIMVNSQKQIFLLLDQNLYHVNAGLQKIAGNVTGWFFSAQDNSLIVIHAGEISFYDFGSNIMNFVTRSGQTLANPRLNDFTNYAFFFKDKTLTALELDSRDHQNEYSFYSAAAPEKFYVDTEAKNLYILDNKELKTLHIRP
jgi:hypothetical protein